MKKTELLREISKKVDGATQKDIAVVLDAFAEVMLDTLRADHAEKVALPGIGTFSVKEVPERRGVSQMGEKKEWVKPAHSEVAFKVSKAVKTLD